MRRLLGITLVAMVWAGLSNAQSLRVATDVDADSVTVGETFTVSYTLTYPDSLFPIPLEVEDPGSCRVLSIRSAPPARASGMETRTVVVKAMTLDLESAFFPAPAIRFTGPAGDTLRTRGNDIEIPVRFMAADTSQPRPLKAQWEAPRKIWPWVVAGAAVLALALLAAYLWRRRPTPPLPEVTAPVLPADYVAMTELTRIEKLGLLQTGEFKTYYSLVTAAIRNYLRDRYGIDAIDMTTLELLDAVQRQRLEIPHLTTLLSRADLVKFAKHPATEDSGKALMHDARSLIAATAPKVVPAEESPAAGSEESDV